MNWLNKKALMLLLTLAWLMSFATVMAAEDSRLSLSVENLNLTVGEETTVDLLVENMPQVYGADVQLTFDPQVLEVVDADKQLAGVQVQAGDFIDIEQGFPLRNQVDNENGIIHYALTLMNPAPAVEGNGVLTRITFRAKADGQSNVRIKTGEFGTREGVVVKPAWEAEPVVFTINRNPTPIESESTEQLRPLDDMTSVLGISTESLMIGAGVIVVFILLFLIQSVRLALLRRNL